MRIRDSPWHESEVMMTSFNTPISNLQSPKYFSLRKLLWQVCDRSRDEHRPHSFEARTHRVTRKEVNYTAQLGHTMFTSPGPLQSGPTHHRFFILYLQHNRSQYIMMYVERTHQAIVTSIRPPEVQARSSMISRHLVQRLDKTCRVASISRLANSQSR